MPGLSPAASQDGNDWVSNSPNGAATRGECEHGRRQVRRMGALGHYYAGSNRHGNCAAIARYDPTRGTGHEQHHHSLGLPVREVQDNTNGSALEPAASSADFLGLQDGATARDFPETRSAPCRTQATLVLEFGGAAGTLATLSEPSSYGAPPNSRTYEPIGLRCQRLLAEELGLAVPSIAWHTERDNFAEFSCFIAILTSTCAKYATDLKLMMQSEVGEASEPYLAHRGSSSTMPQKRNPIGCAYVHSMAISVRNMANGMIEAVNADHERSTGPWQIEWIMLPQICALGVACLKQTLYLVNGVEVNDQVMQRNLDMSKGAIVSEAVMMGLGKTLGRQYAHDIVYDLCRKAQIEEEPLLKLLKTNGDIREAGLKDEELERLCDRRTI